MSTDLMYSFIWACRFLVRNGTALESLEKRAERRLLDALGPGEGEVTEIPRVAIDDLDLAAREGLFTGDAPVVVEGALRGSRALEWSLDVLRSRYGRTPADGDVRLPGGPRAATIADVIDAIQAGEEACAGATMRIFHDNPETVRDLNVARIERAFQREIVTAQMFLSSPKSTTYYHSEFAVNLSVQVHGQKKWTLIAPDRQAQMYPDVGHRDRRDLFYYLAARPYAKDASGAMAPAFAPLIERAPKHVTVLSPGDVLYCPMWWWHEVTNPTPAVGIGLRLVPTAAELARRPVRTLLGMAGREPMRMAREAIVDRLRGRPKHMAVFAPAGLDPWGDRRDQLVV